MENSLGPHRAPHIVHVADWHDLKAALQYLDGYLFRGHRVAEWKLEPSLWRDSSLPPAEEREGVEHRLLKAFRRRAHHYVANPPPPNYRVEWLSLLRHFGGPTRLLDVSWSPFVAAFFALEGAKAGGTACIWAVHAQALKVNPTTKLREVGRDIGSDLVMFDESTEHAADNLMTNANHWVTFIEPFRLNERIAVQQGAFILPLSLDNELYDDLLRTLDIDPGFTPKHVTFNPTTVDPTQVRDSLLVQLVFPGDIRQQALKELHLMNVNAATLYPGLEGFARSLGTRLSVGEF